MNADNRTLLNMAVLCAIREHVGKDFAIKRGTLVHQMRMLGFGDGMLDQALDRRVREAIAWLRTNEPDGAFICSDNAGTGYWRAENLEELARYLETEKGRGLDILEKVSAQSKRAGVILKGQASYG